MDANAYYEIMTRYFLILDGDRRGGGGGGFDNYRRRSPEPVKERPRIVLQPRSAKKVREVLVTFCLVIQV